MNPLTKAWCIWHETGVLPKTGYYWICPECFFKLTSITTNLTAVEEYLKGIRPKTPKDTRQSVDQFLEDMYDFDRRSRNTWKLIKSVTQGTPLEPLELEAQAKLNIIYAKDEVNKNEN